MTVADSDEQGDGEGISELSGRHFDGRYRLDERLGGGAMGEVYRGEHTRMHKTVAVKVLRPDVVDAPNVVERFRREAAAAANLEHPNVCAATDFGKTEDGYYFLVMEHVEGETLRAMLDRRAPLPIPEVIEIADQIAAALQRARELEIVHRDVKPENIMLIDPEAEGLDLKVLDFGVAHVEFDDRMASLTKTGEVFGTPTFMSPEQATSDRVDHRADLYALGAVMFTMLTGRRVFQADDPGKLMAQHIMEEPDPPSEVREGGSIPPALEELVMELLEKDPEHRPQTASEVRERLQSVEGSDSSEPEPASPLAPTAMAPEGEGSSGEREVSGDGATPVGPPERDEPDGDRVFGILVGVVALCAVAIGLLAVGSLVLQSGESPDEGGGAAAEEGSDEEGSERGDEATEEARADEEGSSGNTEQGSAATGAGAGEETGADEEGAGERETDRSGSGDDSEEEHRAGEQETAGGDKMEKREGGTSEESTADDREPSGEPEAERKGRGERIGPPEKKGRKGRGNRGGPPAHKGRK